MLTSRIEPRAVHALPNQFTSSPSTRLISPKSVLNMSRHSSSIAKDGMAYVQLLGTPRLLGAEDARKWWIAAKYSLLYPHGPVGPAPPGVAEFCVFEVTVTAVEMMDIPSLWTKRVDWRPFTLQRMGPDDTWQVVIGAKDMKGG